MSERLLDRRRRPGLPGQRRRRLVPLSLVIVLGLLGLFALVSPLRLPLNINPASVTLPTATLRPTSLPAPTDVHGGKIVFTCTRGAVNQICMIHADGSGYEQLTSGTANSYYPAISPDGDSVIYAVNQYDVFDIFRLAPDVREGARSALSRTKKLTDNVGNAFGPSFSPDGQSVLFVNRVGSGPASLWTMSNNGQDARPLYTPPSDIVGAEWSPSGRAVAFLMSSGPSFAYEVFLLDAADPSIPPKRVPSGLRDIGGSLSWAPDEQDLLVFAGPAAAREVYRLEVSTGHATQLTYGGNNASPAYSPDGKFIVYNSLRNGGQADLYIMLADGHSTRQLTDHPEPDWQPQWGP